LETFADGGTASGSEERVEHLDAIVTDLRERLASAEKELETPTVPPDVHRYLETLAARVGALEDTTGPQGDGSSLLGGDGRFLVEVRSLELRMQHAEESARENREAVLVQLERLASRVEWRLQRLETPEVAEESPVEHKDEPAREAIGQVVPLRGGAET
jgi:uncharacterized membrane protein YccC